MTLALSVDGLRTVTRLQQRREYTRHGNFESDNGMGAAMNWSMFAADRATHLKVAVAGLTAVLLIAVVRIFV
jgi:hypothetical protein